MQRMDERSYGVSLVSSFIILFHFVVPTILTLFSEDGGKTRHNNFVEFRARYWFQFCIYDLLQRLRNMPGSVEGKFVFMTHRGTRFRRVDKEVEAFGLRIGIKGFHKMTWHSNRKQGITDQATKAGEDHVFQKTVMSQSRHAHIGSQERYVEPGEAGLARFMDRLEGKEESDYSLKDYRKVLGGWAGGWEGLVWKKKKVEELQMVTSDLMNDKYRLVKFIYLNGLMAEWNQAEQERKDEEEEDNFSDDGDGIGGSTCLIM